MILVYTLYLYLYLYLEIPSGDSCIDVLCMYAALEVYLDDYDNFLKVFIYLFSILK